MKRGLIILIILIAGFVSAEDNVSIVFNYPNEVSTNEEFEVEIFLINFNEEVYDIKFEIVDDSGSNIAQRFWENEWKSTNFWMNDCFNALETNSTKFNLKINKEYDGFNNMGVKIRDESGKVIEFKDYVINISSSSQNKGYADVALNWEEDDIINGKSFKIEVEVDNLEKKNYDARIWIESEDKVISDRYDEEKNEWKSGLYYINNIFSGPGDISKKVKLRIREEYGEFSGDADILFKMRNDDEYKEDIEVLEKEIVEVEPEETEIYAFNSEENDIEELAPLTGEAIKLGSKKALYGEKNSKEDIIYESRTEIIKKYYVYGFVLLCVILTVLIGWKKLE